MIRIFNKNERIFLNNGEKILNPLKAIIHKEDNGDYYLDLEASTDYINYIIEGNIIVVPTPTGEQAFRISNVEKKRTKISCKCWHIFYDTNNYLIEDSYIVEKNCNAALDHVNSNTDIKSPFITLSDVDNINSYRVVRKSLYEAIQTIIERWGGHLVRDNFNIKIMNQIGKDNGAIIRYKKNLKEIVAKEDWTNVVTKILPVGKDGVLLDEVYMESDIKYDIPYTKIIEFKQDIKEEDYKDSSGKVQEEQYINALKENLRIQAREYLNYNKYPKVNYTLNANLEKITDIGDTIQVIDDRLNINLLTNVIAYEYDSISNKYKSIEFGNFKNKLSDFRKTVSNEMNKVVEQNNVKIKKDLDIALEKAEETILGSLGSSYVVYEKGQILVVDTLPKEQAKNVMRINSGGIAFSQDGIKGKFTSAWTLDGIFNAQNINVINFTADLIKGGILKLGGKDNTNGAIEVYDVNNKPILKIDKTGAIFTIGNEETDINKLNNTINNSVKTAKMFFALGDSREVAPITGWTEQAPLNKDGALFMWQKTVIYLNDGTEKESVTCISGASAVGIKSVDLMYYLSTSNKELKDGNWITTPPEWEKGKYLWTKQVTTYTEGKPAETTPICVTGSDGKGIKTIVEQYCLSASNSEPPIEGWLNYQEPWKENYYFWTRQQIIWEDDTTTITAPILALNLTDIERKTNENSKQMEIQKKQYSELDIKYGNIVGTVETNRQVYEQDKETLNSTISNLTERVDSVITPKQVELKIQEEIEKGVDKVKTSTGFTFDKDGLKVSKDGTEMSTQIKEDGMTVYRDKEKMLVANNQGVDAVNLHASTYLIIGNNSRFEDFEKYGKQMTGCFWIGKPTTRNLKEVNK